MRKSWLAVASLAIVLVACGTPAGTARPATSAPQTGGPATSAPQTGAPATSAPATSAPATSAPSTSNPADLGPIRVGVEAPGGEAYIPTQLTVKRMQDMGYDIEIIQFEDPDVMPQALDSGQIHVNTNSVGQIFAAVDAGLEIKAIQGLTDPEFFMVA